MSRVTRWCFTLNNFVPEDEAHITEFGERFCKYLVFGRETGEQGTPHLQGFCVLKNSQRLSYVRSKISPRGHYEEARGTNEEASDYCKKEGDYFETGQLPRAAGNGSRFEAFRLWVEDQEETPTEREIACQFPDLFIRYPRLIQCVEHWRPRPQLMGAGPHELRPWQQELRQELEEDPDDRTIIFYIDPEGAQGKSWFTRWYHDKYGDSQLLRVGKRDDLAHAIDPSKRVFFFDVPRGQLEYFQYNILEQLKDKFVFSPKYNSRNKVLEKVPHVVVFSNENYKSGSLSEDRVVIRELSANNILT